MTPLRPLIPLLIVAVIFVTLAAVLSIRRGSGGGAEDEREGFAAELREDRPFRVFQTKPRRGIRVIVPAAEKPHPGALKGLRRYGDAGVSVVKDLSPAANLRDTGEIVDAFAGHDDLVVGDTASLFLAKKKKNIRVLSYLRDSEKHFCVFGGVVSREDDDERDAGNETTLRNLLSPSSSSPRPKFLCVSRTDVWMLKTVAAISAGVLDLGAVADVERVRLEDLGSARRTREENRVVACLLTKRHRDTVWGSWKERDAVWYDYWNDMDAARLRVSLPFYKPVALDIRHALLPSLQGLRNIYTTVAVDAVLLGRASLGSHPLLPLVAEVVVRADVDREMDVVTSNNYLMQHFAFYRATHDVCAAKNAEIFRKRSGAVEGGALTHVGRPRFQILEQFAEGPDTTTSTDTVSTEAVAEISMMGRKVRAYRETLPRLDRKVARVTMNVREEPALRVHHEKFMTLRGIPVRPWDRVILDGEKGGTFFVETLDPEGGRLALLDKWVFAFDPSRGDAGSLDLEGRAVHMTLSHSGEGREPLRSRGPHEAPVRQGDPVYVTGFGDKERRKRGLVGVVEEGDGPEETRVLLEIEVDEEEREEEEEGGDVRFGGGGHHICVEDMRVQSRAHCEAEGLTWDRPCRTDEECPYFQANRRYRNYRGGCSDGGYCEMPVGVNVRGFRVPEPSPAPACHGCDPWDFRCCEKQEREEEDGPDFAFVDDFIQRQRQRVSTASVSKKEG